MPIRLPFRAFALIFPFTLGIACASMSGHASARRDFAYARAGDSIVVAVSTHGRSGDELRLADDAVAYLEPPRAVAVARCSARQSR